MLSALIAAVRQRHATDATGFPDLPDGVRSLPRLTNEPCVGSGCSKCVSACPTAAIKVSEGGQVALDRGQCVTCGACVEACPSGTIAYDRSTRTAAIRREDLVLRTDKAHDLQEFPKDVERPFKRSVDVREVSTGCNATDMEVAATTNAIFDCSRFGIHFVASPRFADALVVTGPVARSMQEPLKRCYEAMADPRLVIAVGTCAISGGVHRGGYAEANGACGHVPVDAFVPGCPPHPWSIIHGILLAAGSDKAPVPE